MLENCINVANQYIKFRLAGDHYKILNLCTEDVILDSERDGVYSGKTELFEYLTKIKPSGKWESAQLLGTDKVSIQGIVSILWMDWKVIAIFSYDRGKIKKIELKKQI